MSRVKRVSEQKRTTAPADASKSEPVSDTQLAGNATSSLTEERTHDILKLPDNFMWEAVALADLKPHPKNYWQHPEDEILHLMESIKSDGIYRNVVIAQDNTILAGRGVTVAAARLGYTTIPVHRRPYGPDDPRALRLLVGDNEISHLAMDDDRALTELLKELQTSDEDLLLGTGYDELMLANLLFVTRPASEIRDLDAAAQWVGMPEYGEAPGQLQLMMHFACEEDRAAFCQQLGLDVAKVAKQKYAWWPERAKNDWSEVAFAQARDPIFESAQEEDIEDAE